MAANCIYELFGTESYHTAELKEPWAAIAPGVQIDRLTPSLSVLSSEHVETYVVIPELPSEISRSQVKTVKL